MIRTDSPRILDAAPTHAPIWTVDLPRPERIGTDAEADAEADRLAPAGWSRAGLAIQGRDRHLRPVIRVTYHRDGRAPSPYDATTRPSTVTLARGA